MLNEHTDMVALYNMIIGHRGLECIEIKVKGKVAHGGVPNLGINAISKAAKLILEIEEEIYSKLEERFNKYMSPSVMNFGRIKGENQPSTITDWCSIIIEDIFLVKM